MHHNKEDTYCDGCKKFSKGNVCPNCYTENFTSTSYIGCILIVVMILLGVLLGLICKNY